MKKSKARTCSTYDSVQVFVHVSLPFERRKKVSRMKRFYEFSRVKMRGESESGSENAKFELNRSSRFRVKILLRNL